MPFRDAKTIRSDAMAALDAAGSTIRTETGEPVVDLVDAFSLQAQRQSIIANYIEAIGSIPGWQSIINDTAFKVSLADALGISSTTLNADLARRLGVPNDLASDVEAVLYLDLNRFATSFGRSRKPAVPATGTERLYLSSSAAFTASRGATLAVTSSNGAQVLFDTTTDFNGVTPAFDITRNQYYVDSSITCRTAGRIGNRIKGSINSIQTTIPGVVQVTNLVPTDGGIDRETNDQLLTALSGVAGGAAINTKQGLINYLSGVTGIQDVYIAGPGDPLMTRATAGAIDIWVIGQTVTTVVVNIQLGAAAEKDTLPYQPVLSVNSVVGATVYGEGGGYLYQADNGVYAYSAQAVGAIQFLPPPGGPNTSEVVAVNFSYNSLVRDTQRIFDTDPQENVPATALLLKQGLQQQIIFLMKVIPLPGVSQNNAQQAVQDTLTQFLSGFKLGQTVEYSVLLTQAQLAQFNNQPAIDRIDGFKVAVLGHPLDVNDITFANNQYARLWNITFISP